MLIIYNTNIKYSSTSQRINLDNMNREQISQILNNFFKNNSIQKAIYCSSSSTRYNQTNHIQHNESSSVLSNETIKDLVKDIN